MLYAQINKKTNQMVGEPMELPSSFSLDGAIITGLHFLSDEILFVMGWVPCVVEEITDTLSFYLSTVPEYDVVHKVFRFAALPTNKEDHVQLALDSIDKAASDACAKYMSVGVGQEMRYLEKYSQAFLYTNAPGTPVENILMLKLEADACGVSLEDKAIEILETRKKWAGLAATVESIRMRGKKDCKEAVTVRELLSVVSSVTKMLEAL